ncbi:MAG: hypothetical protein MRZ79_20585 [Bacteroidia bacterium]|nr:hypothetical protein [Bacteroidia bacterium]
MNIWVHSCNSVEKFGGKPEDYLEIHKFIDSSKYYFYHYKHRAMLHHNLGATITEKAFGKSLVNSLGIEVPMKRIVEEHTREDISGEYPTVDEWFEENNSLKECVTMVPKSTSEAVNSFIQSPLELTANKASMIITCSDFGVSLIEKIFGMEEAILIRNQIPRSQHLSNILPRLSLNPEWAFGM